MDRFDLPRRLTAEALGTCFLVAAVIGSGIMAETLTRDAALALLVNTIATSAALVVLITVLGPISGAHFNPAVSMIMALRQKLTVREFAAYAAAQLTGGLLGTVVAHLMFGRTVFEMSQQIRTGSAQWFSEAVATFGLILVILTGLRGARESVAWVVGLYIAAAYWFTASTSFANPAVTIARAFSDSFAGIRPIDAPAFVAAQLGGAMAGLFLCAWLMEERK